MLTCLFASLVVPVCQAEDTAHLWHRWEHALTSRAQYANPYADVVLRVTYTGPGDTVIRAYGFWDGGSTFRIRCAFPQAGAWRWRTECSSAADAGLHQQSGTVRVRPAERTDNPLWRHGFLRVSDGRRYLCHADGTPFLWMGDTAWAAPMLSTDEEWEEYLADRAEKRFTVIQVGPAMWWAGKTDRAGNPPFIGEGIRQWNPAFWQAYERKLERASERGFAVMMTGLMEPTERYPSSEDACLFARNIVARLFGNCVAFSPSFDSGFMDLGNDVGRAVRDATQVHLITQHPGTPSGHATNDIIERYYDEAYLDFAGDQSGHNGGNRELCAHQAMEWNLHLYRREPHKPVINLEAMYDVGGEKGAFVGDDARSLGWRSFLSGAAGYTYGTDLYAWNTDETAQAFWRTQMRQESSRQMTILHDFLAGLPWWQLEPHHERVLNQPESAVRRAPLALTPDARVIVVYVPDPEPRELDLGNLPVHSWKALWLDPRTGDTHAGGRVTADGPRTVTPPGAGDWVVMLRAD
jgi:hypothetical protein